MNVPAFSAAAAERRTSLAPAEWTISTTSAIETPMIATSRGAGLQPPASAVLRGAVPRWRPMPPQPFQTLVRGDLARGSDGPTRLCAEASFPLPSKSAQEPVAPESANGSGVPLARNGRCDAQLRCDLLVGHFLVDVHFDHLSLLGGEFG